MKKILVISIFIVILGAAGFYFWQNFRGAVPAFRPPSQDISEFLPKTGETPPEIKPAAGETKTGIPLKLPPGFSIEIFAKDLPGARVMAQDRFGNIWVSQTKEGKITLLEVGEDGKVTNRQVIFEGLRRPHGLAFDPQNGAILYIAEEHRISRVQTYSEGNPEKIIDLPLGDRHFTRTIGFGPDERLYVSIGSTCDVCYEKDPRHAAIYSLKKDGSDFKEFARGLRNAVFFTFRPGDGKMWATEMGRDWLGDDLPPDEINIIEEGKDYGWPICYGKNLHDADFDKNVYIRDPCADKIPSRIEIPAHSAPLGLAFIPESPNLPEEYWSDLLIAYHGSWNRSEPTGYKVVRAKLDDKGNFLGFEDFITGWLRGGEALGRPVDILALPNGIIYISDDHAGVIYRVIYK